MTSAEIVSVVACGPSALECGAARAPGYVIAVNGACDHVRHDAVLTMDGRFARHRAPDFVGKPFYCRASAWAHVKKEHPNLTPWRGLNVFDCDWKTQWFSPSVGQLNGSNSGYVALNLAYVMHPRLVWLYGFDMTEPTHFFGDYAWKSHAASNTRGKFVLWAREMRIAAQQFMAAGIVVYNTNKKSAITAFQKVSAP